MARPPGPVSAIFQARNNLRAMKKGRYPLLLSTVSPARTSLGLAKVAKEAYADPTAKEGDWSCVDIEPFKPVKVPVSLETLKSDKILKEMLLAKHGRISVTPVTKEQFERLMELAETKV